MMYAHMPVGHITLPCFKFGLLFFGIKFVGFVFSARWGVIIYLYFFTPIPHKAIFPHSIICLPSIRNGCSGSWFSIRHIRFSFVFRPPSPLHHNIHHPPRHIHHLLRLLIVQEAHDAIGGQRQFFHLVFAQAHAHLQPVAHFAVDLHDDRDHFLGGDGGVVLRPGLLMNGIRLLAPRPQFFRNVRRDRRHQQQQRIQRLVPGGCPLGRLAIFIQRVRHLHQRRDDG